MINIDKNLFLQQESNIIVIASGMSGAGKTWFAATLAHAMHNLRKKVLLVDADNGLLNTNFQLGLTEDLTLNDIFEQNVTLNQIIRPISKKKFDILYGRTGSDFLEGLPCGKLQTIREYMLLAAKNYDYVIIDTSSSEKIMTHLIPAAADLILICQKDPSNLVETYNFLQKLAENKLGGNLQIVVNYAASQEEGLRTYNTLRLACKKYMISVPHLLGIVRQDTRVRDVIRNHVMLLSRYPSCEAAEDVIKIAAKIVENGEKNEQ